MRYLNKLLSVIIYCCVLIGFIAGTGYAQTLKIYEVEEPIAFDPLTGDNPEWERFISLYCWPLFELLQPRKYGDPYLPVLAKEAPSKSGDSRWVVIRPDAYFYRFSDDKKRTSDSVKVTAEDVVQNYRALINNNSQFRTTKFSERLKRQIKEMKALGRDTVKITYNPDYTNSNYGALSFPIVPKEVLSGGVVLEPQPGTPQYKYMKKPWGSGPWALNRVKAGRTYEFKRMDSQRGNVYSSLEWEVKDFLHIAPYLENGPGSDEVCIPYIPFSKLTNLHDDFKSIQLYNPEVEQIVFNTKKSLLSDQRIRAALSLYIDRSALLSTTFKGEGYLVNGPMPANYAYNCNDCDIPFYEFDPDMADSLMKNAGWTKDVVTNRWKRDNKFAEIKILASMGSEGSYIAEISNQIAKAWKQYGFVSESEIVTKRALNDRLQRGEYDAAYQVIIYGLYPELYDYYGSRGIRNFSNLESLIIDSTWNTFFKDISPAQYEKNWKDLQREIGNLVPCAFLWSLKKGAVYSRLMSISQEFYTNNFLRLAYNWKIAE
jgi:ABC-type transport system substrate-binding protein